MRTSPGPGATANPAIVLRRLRWRYEPPCVACGLFTSWSVQIQNAAPLQFLLSRRQESIWALVLRFEKQDECSIASSRRLAHTRRKPGKRDMRVAIFFVASLLIASPAWSGARCASCARNSRNRIKRSSTARREFEKAHPCPATGRSSGGCPGYVVDHVKPLKRGGADTPSNMQWQTKQAAKAKDRIE
jgi:hypothetical protein